MPTAIDYATEIKNTFKKDIESIDMEMSNLRVSNSDKFSELNKKNIELMAKLDTLRDNVNRMEKRLQDMFFFVTL